MAHFSFVVLMIDFEGRPQPFKFVMDSIDMAMSICFVVMVILRIILELKMKGRLTRIAVADIGITLICLGGVIYEAIIASDLDEFLLAETLVADLLRTCKCLKLYLLFLERKYYWKKLHDLLKVVGKTLLNILPTFGIWFATIFAFAVMGHHIEGGRILVNGSGEVDMEEGQANRFNFEDIYHSLVFVLLDSFNEEWDYLTFREYLGVNPAIIGFQMMAMFVCYLLFSKYLTGSYTNELDALLTESQDPADQQEQKS